MHEERLTQKGEGTRRWDSSGRESRLLLAQPSAQAPGVPLSSLPPGPPAPSLQALPVSSPRLMMMAP